jgi:hypothetical protein
MTLERHRKMTSSALAARPAADRTRSSESLQPAGLFTRAEDPADRSAKRRALATSRREGNTLPSERDPLSPCRRS